MQSRNHYIPETYVLEIPAATESDVGSYTCTARNCYGSVTSSANVRILDLKTQYPCFQQRLKRTDIFAGRNAYLPVKVSGSPQPDVKWFKNSRPLIENERIELRHYGPHSHVLHINDAEPKDAGLYTCQARNNVGIASTSAMVNVEKNDPLHMYKPAAQDCSVDYDRISRQLESHLRPNGWSQRNLDDYLYRLSVANYHIKYRTERE
ncbi:Obscurin, partial [Pseudolycoriella hygida]